MVEFETVICNDCLPESPLESETEIAKIKFPTAVSVPEITPVESASSMPAGSWPDATEKT